jgi:hypothetical protein
MERVLQGLCGKCGKCKPAENRKLCIDCLNQYNAKNRERRKKRQASGKCWYCSRPRTRGRCCDIHYINCVARNHYQRTYGIKWEKLEQLFDEQKGLCALSGLPIIIGINAELDHKTACATGGDSSLSNLQWLHRDVNMMKQDIPLERFIALCYYVSQMHGKSIDISQNMEQCYKLPFRTGRLQNNHQYRDQ